MHNNAILLYRSIEKCFNVKVKRSVACCLHPIVHRKVALSKKRIPQLVQTRTFRLKVIGASSLLVVSNVWFEKWNGMCLIGTLMEPPTHHNISISVGIRSISNIQQPQSRYRHIYQYCNIWKWGTDKYREISSIASDVNDDGILCTTE